VSKKTEFVVQLKGNSSSYTNSVFKARAANDAFHKSVGGVSKGLTAVNGPLNGVTGRFTALSSLATSGAGAFALFGAAMAGSALAVASAVKEYDGYERQQLKVQQMLETTGYAAGLNAKQLATNADAVALATLASVDGIQEAQGVLLSFKAVQGETFTEAISLAQDMAAVFGGTAKDKALQLGKALQSPTDGLTALKKSGVDFTQSQKDLIKQLDRTGQRAEAQKIILNELRDQVGGAGAAQAGGLSGSVDTLGQRWDELRRKWAESSGTAKTVQGWIDGLAEGFRRLGENIEPSVDGLTKKLGELEDKLAGGSRRQTRGGFLAREIAQVREQLMLAKAEQGDLESLNAAIANTRDNISGLQAAVDKNGTTTTGPGRSKTEVESQDSKRLTTEKAELDGLLALQKTFAAQKAESVASQKAMEEQAAADVLISRQSKAQIGLDAIIQAQASREEQMILASENRQMMIDEARQSELINDDRWNELTQNNWQAHQNKLTEINKKESKKRAQNEAAAQKAAFSAMGQSAGELMSALEGSNKERTGLYKAMFLAQKAAAIPSMIASTEEGATAALKLGPIAGPPAAMGIRAMGYASIGLVAGQAVAGVAHGGMGYIPEESTYLLQRGEGVLSPKQNVEVQKMAADFNGGKNSVNPIIVNVIEDSSRAGQVTESQGQDGEQMIDVFVANIREGGSAASEIENTYGLQRKGR
jgi:hypothetical protein